MKPDETLKNLDTYEYCLVVIGLDIFEFRNRFVFVFSTRKRELKG